MCCTPRRSCTFKLSGLNRTSLLFLYRGNCSTSKWIRTNIEHLRRMWHFHLCYEGNFERIERIELSSPTWKDGVITTIRYSQIWVGQRPSAYRDLNFELLQGIETLFYYRDWRIPISFSILFLSESVNGTFTSIVPFCVFTPLFSWFCNISRALDCLDLFAAVAIRI